jgi:glutathione S-transferase
MKDLRLRYSKTSPYARKVRIVAHELELVHRLELISTDTWNLPDALLSENPLGKVPSLSLGDGGILYDSPVICEYLASLNHPNELFPAAGARRWRALRLQALGDGMMDAAVECFAERNFRPPEQQSEPWIERMKASVTRALDHLDKVCESEFVDLTIGTIATASALGYLDLRFAEDHWRAGRPGLSRWFDAFSLRPSFISTKAEA